MFEVDGKKICYNLFVSEFQEQEHKDRINPGQIVYFTEPDNVLGARTPDFTLVVKKATVKLVGEKHTFPVVLIWNDIDKDPKGMGTAVAKSPEELFTEEELQLILKQAKNKGIFQSWGIDDSIRNASSNRKLAPILSEAVRERMD